MRKNLKYEITAYRLELEKLISIRESLSGVILWVSQRLDLLVLEYTRAMIAKEEDTEV